MSLPGSPFEPGSNTCDSRPLRIIGWNCRGLSNSIPYITKLIKDGSDILVISEHWLWPYNLQQLDSVHPSFMSWAQAIPPVLKSTYIIPIYKGNGKDPLNADSYRGITITSVIAKVLEFFILERMECIFLQSRNVQIPISINLHIARESAVLMPFL